MISQLIDSAVILPHVNATTKLDVLREVVDALVAAGRLDAVCAGTVGDLLAARETLGSTGIGNGIAVPHVKSDEVKELGLALARAPDGIEYAAIDGRPVQTLFLLVAPADDPEAHLQALKWVSSLARNSDFRRFVQSAAAEQDIRELLHEMSDGHG